MADILFVTMETGGLADKSSIYFLLSKTHSILLAEEITRFAEIKKLSYLPVMCGLKIPDIVELRISIIMLKAYHNLLPTYVQQFFRQHESVYATQQNYTFTQKLAHMKSMRLLIKGVQLWNSSDSSLIFCHNVHLFKNNYKGSILNSYISDM